MPSTSTSSVRHRKPAGAESFISLLLAQSEVDALCEMHGVPKEFTARLAGDMPVSSAPPPGAVCVHAHALEAGMRLPLHGFFCQALAHFGVAPAQLTPNGWRTMAGFLVLCHSAGVPPSLAVFRHFFTLFVINKEEKGWYFFRSRDSSGLGFKGMPTPPANWRKHFFFLSSTKPWPCPVEWGEPSKASLIDPSLTGEEKRWAAKLLRVHGGGAVDLCDSNLAATMSTTKPSPPPTTSTCTTSSPRGMDPSVYSMMKTLLAEKAAAQPAKKMKADPGCQAPVLSPLCGEKKGLEEAGGEEDLPPSVVYAPPPGFSRKPQQFPSRHDPDSTDWEAARELLESAVAPSQKRVLAAKEPSDIVASSYVAILQATNYASFSLAYAQELEEKLAERDAEIAALREQLEETNGELAAAKRAEEATEAMRRLLGSEERERRRAEHAIEGYRRWKDSRSAERRT